MTMTMTIAIVIIFIITGHGSRGRKSEIVVRADIGTIVAQVLALACTTESALAGAPILGGPRN